MLPISKKKMILFVTYILLLDVHNISYAAVDIETTRLKEQLEIGEVAEAKLSARRDKELKKIFNSGLSQKEIEIKAEAVLETYRVESSKLAATYRQPLIEH